MNSQCIERCRGNSTHVPRATTGRTRNGCDRMPVAGDHGVRYYSRPELKFTGFKLSRVRIPQFRRTSTGQFTVSGWTLKARRMC